MVAVLVGAVLVAAGWVGASNSFRAVDAAARMWPHERGDVTSFASANFIIRFVSILVLAAGIALIWSRA
jgi:hypothetical protein